MLADFAAELGPTASLMIVTHRPEFSGALEAKSTRRLTLRPLPRDTALGLVRQVLGGDPTVRHLRDPIVDAAAGNPFFVEEIIRDLADRAILDGSRGGYRLVGQLAVITVPATVQAVLAARIDRLPPATKAVLNAAAVIGLRFDLDTVRVLLPGCPAGLLADLVAAELIDQTEFVPAQRYCFHHPLVRSVAYDSQLSTTRATAHGALARALAERGPADESAALIATHLEAAGDFLDAHQWHMRAAEWLRPRDLAAARDQWDKARQLADLLPAGLAEKVRLQIAPRAMISSTSLYLRDDLPVDDVYQELYELSRGADDLTPLAVGMAGRIFSLCVNEFRVPDAMTLADELESITPALRCDAATRGILGNALAFARFAGGDFRAALAVCDDILDLVGLPVTERAPALALRGFLDICVGDALRGRRDLAAGTRMARPLHPVNYASVQLYSAVMAALGILDAGEMLADKRAALRRAEAFGDMCGIVMAQWSYGTVLLRDGGSATEASAVLDLARRNSRQYGIGTCSQCTITPDLAVRAARGGHRDEAIAELRRAFQRFSRCFPALAVFAAEALVGLLIDRGSAEDLAEVGRILDRWENRLRAAPALLLWAEEARARLAAARGDHPASHAAALRYLRSCERIDARGRLPAARTLAARSAAARAG